ncbi:unnamed protein product [Symbiodinium natans]|uniref:Uncharacterized protein n=1 Tax=Symbiodinium natans TaxID=878477 RepID=A0A812NAE6_9DINO|nr:unnamed protein product [Symbiodinium natans]
MQRCSFAGLRRRFLVEGPDNARVPGSTGNGPVKPDVPSHEAAEDASHSWSTCQQPTAAPEYPPPPASATVEECRRAIADLGSRLRLPAAEVARYRTVADRIKGVLRSTWRTETMEAEHVLSTSIPCFDDGHVVGSLCNGTATHFGSDVDIVLEWGINWIPNDMLHDLAGVVFVVKTLVARVVLLLREVEDLKLHKFILRLDTEPSLELDPTSRHHFDFVELRRRAGAGVSLFWKDIKVDISVALRVSEELIEELSSKRYPYPMSDRVKPILRYILSNIFSPYVMKESAMLALRPSLFLLSPEQDANVTMAEHVKEAVVILKLWLACFRDAQLCSTFMMKTITRTLAAESSECVDDPAAVVLQVLDFFANLWKCEEGNYCEEFDVSRGSRQQIPGRKGPLAVALDNKGQSPECEPVRIRSILRNMQGRPCMLEVLTVWKELMLAARATLLKFKEGVQLLHLVRIRNNCFTDAELDRLGVARLRIPPVTAEFVFYTWGAWDRWSETPSWTRLWRLTHFPPDKRKLDEKEKSTNKGAHGKLLENNAVRYDRTFDIKLMARRARRDEAMGT